MKKLLESTYGIFLTLGIVWFIVGFVIYDDTQIWPLGLLFLLIGFIRFVSRKKQASQLSGPINSLVRI